jgi:hypothetical protein
VTRSLAALAAAAMSVIALSAACGGTTDKSSASSEDMARYVQTWSRDYDHTTCAQWKTSMTEAQRWTAAYEMLRDDRAGDGGIAKVPADKLVDRFKADITSRCTSPTAAAKAIPDAAQDAFDSGKTAYGS